ncbi:hypothetical protein DZG01_05870 [Pseudomonas fluorescens]|nr:hypothetical protein DZG01_05870 [Pseudomonas fluorescens]
MWRGDLSPLGCAAALKAPTLVHPSTACTDIGAATQPNGDKSPRHSHHPPCYFCRTSPPAAGSTPPTAAG